MILGFMNTNYSYVYTLPENSDTIVVFKYGLLKNSIMLLIMFLNSFSVIGFPLTATSLVLNGYLLSVSVSTLYANNNENEMYFLMRNFPHIGLNIASNLLLAEAVFKFSQSIFSVTVKNRYRGNLGVEMKNLILRVVLCVTITVASSSYEAFIL